MFGLGGGGSGGGDDRLLVGIGLTCMIYTVVVTLLLSILLPANLAADYSFEEVYSEREALAAYNGESLTSNTPWTLQAVYTPWLAGTEYGITESGWIYGHELGRQHVERAFQGKIVTKAYHNTSQTPEEMIEQAISENNDIIKGDVIIVSGICNKVDNSLVINESVEISKIGSDEVKESTPKELDIISISSLLKEEKTDSRTVR